jgi:hypothetical protein
MQAQQLDLAHLGRLGEAVSEFRSAQAQSALQPPAAWLAAWQAAVAACAAQQQEPVRAVAAVGAALAAHRLSVSLEPQVVAKLLDATVVTATTPAEAAVADVAAATAVAVTEQEVLKSTAGATAAATPAAQDVEKAEYDAAGWQDVAAADLAALAPALAALRVTPSSTFATTYVQVRAGLGFG